MGGFFLDILKDRLYTTGAESHPRRSAQTAMYHIVEAMVRWFAPILTFTAEEIWQALPGEREKSVFLATFKEVPGGDKKVVDWDRLIQVREAVAKELETLRDAGDIGSPLEAVVTVYADGTLRDSLAALGDELRFVFITSEADVKPLSEAPASDDSNAETNGGYCVVTGPSEHAKCIRCWHRREDVGSVDGHPEICGRCVENVDGKGETRAFA